MAVLGYSFKRDADDVRDSLAPKLIRYLSRETPAAIVVTDHHLTVNEIEPCPGLQFTPDLDTALRNADFVFIATNHSLYTEQREKILATVERGARVIDIWDCCGQSRATIDAESLAKQKSFQLRRAAA